MCQYSLEGYPSRDAKDQEQLVLRGIDFCGHLGFFGASAGSKKLVCVKAGSCLTLDRVILRQHLGLRARYAVDFRLAAPWEGKENVVVKMTSWHRGEEDRWVDALEFPDGQRLHLAFFELDTRATVGVKERDLNKLMALDQIKADVPVEKAEAPRLAHLFRL